MRMNKENILKILTEMDMEKQNINLDIIVGIVNHYMELKKRDLSKDEILSLIFQYLNDSIR